MHSQPSFSQFETELDPPSEALFSSFHISQPSVMTDVYAPGTTLHLQTCSEPSKDITVVIEHAFTPYTKSQALRVRRIAGSSDSDAAASWTSEIAVLKLYDRRFINDRRYDKTPWSVARELEAQERWAAIRAGTLVDDFEELKKVDYTESHEEEAHRWLVQERFKTEREAYRRLAHLQGGCLPKLFDAVLLPEPDTLHPHGIPEAQVNGLIFEYIDGENLSSFPDDRDPDSNPIPPITFSSLQEAARLAHPLMAGLATFSLHGVLHNDIRSGNILIASDKSRAVLIDLGQALLRGVTVLDAHWDECVEMEDELEALRRILHRRRVRDRTPYEEPDDTESRSYFNKIVDAEPELWRVRWYYRVEGDASQSDWVTREDVKRWLVTRPAPPKAFTIPRPGSPEYSEPLRGIT